MWFFSVLALVLVFATHPASAEGQALTSSSDGKAALTDCASDPILPISCQKEFDKWWAAEKKWRRWKSENPSSPGGPKYLSDYFTDTVWVRPTVPGWIATYCRRLEQMQVVNPEICDPYQDTLDYDWMAHLQDKPPDFIPVHPVTVGEGSEFWSWFLRNLHLDVAWTPLDNRATFHGVLGMHLTLAQIGDRVFLFGPGVLVVVNRIGVHQKEFRVGNTWGMSIRLKDFRFPGTLKSAGLFLNIANLRLPQVTDLLAQSQDGVSVLGLSIAFRK
ncbi:MAG TPA: hypothetical protein VL306_00860 [Methylomirabilota bacterium]|nr:hypothetical protein [Methylomirabilota bacterium]